MYICDCNRVARVSFIVPTDATDNKWLYIMNSDLPSPFSWDIIWHQMNHVSCVALQQNTWDKMSQCCACRSSLFMMTHFFSAIIVLILCCPIPEVIWKLSIKILGFHTAMSCQDVKLHSVPLHTNVILVPLIFMHLRLVFFFFFFCVDCDQRHFRISFAAVQAKAAHASASCCLVGDEHKQTSFFVVFPFFIYIIQLFPSLCSYSEEVQSYLHTCLILQRVF